MLKILNRWKLWMRRHRWKLLGAFLVLATAYYFCLPKKLFNDPVCTVMLDKDGNLLGAKIAADGQWRFPYNDTVPEKFAKCIVAFEDKRFYKHIGVDIWAIGRAFRQNISTMSTVSGGSTLTMQTLRLSRKGQSRNLWQKLVEVVLATRAELRYSKKEILALYASNAPFGGNVVGLDAAAWKYFGRSANKLSWAESATLAVLPNSPGLIHPGRNRNALRAKRDFLLEKLRDLGEIDAETCELSKLEPLPEAPQPLPMLAPHLLERVSVDAAVRHDAVVHCTIDANMQQQVTDILYRHHLRLRENEIHNTCAVVVEVATGNVLAYVGNAQGCGPEHGEMVDIIPAHRSSGSILKPFLFASMLSDGELLPNMLFPDVPSQYGGYTPKNFDQTYTGAISARNALARSLNIPYVAMLNRYGQSKFHAKLQQLGMSTLTKPASHYGLTLILGGAETSIWDLASMYSSMARTLLQFRALSSRYAPNAFRPINYLQEKTPPPPDLQTATGNTPLSAGAIWHTFEAMQEVVRPEQEGYWQRFRSARQIAWKTGTSFGFRDAWAVGVTPRYVVAVWAGNADGEGRPNLVGVVAAAPILFDIFTAIGRSSDWFDMPYDDMVQVATCRQSGFRAGDLCAEKDTIWAPKNATRIPVCPFHVEVNLDKSGKWRVLSECESPLDMVRRAYFILPPAQEYYYKNHHPDFLPPPPFKKECLELAKGKGAHSMDLIYPKNGTRIYVPKEMNEEKGRTVFEAAHRNSDATIFWHLDDTFLGETKHFHQLAVNPPIGKHTLTLVDDQGEIIVRHIEIVGK